MSKSVLAAAAAMVLLATPAFAMDCGAMLDKSSATIGQMTSATSGKRAALQRMALAGYDHCMAGDEFNARKFFEMIDKERR